jgi:hypothetical protein
VTFIKETIVSPINLWFFIYCCCHSLVLIQIQYEMYIFQGQHCKCIPVTETNKLSHSSQVHVINDKITDKIYNIIFISSPYCQETVKILLSYIVSMKCTSSKVNTVNASLSRRWTDMCLQC